MSEIKIRRAHALPLAQARAAAEKIAARLRKDFDLEYAWDGNALKFQRTGVEGSLHVGAHEIRIDARLGLLVGFLRSRIEAEIEESLDKLLAAPAKPAAKAPAKTPAKAPDKRKKAKDA